jgi:hypothetical protein
MTFEVGKDYKTRGGWKARVIWGYRQVLVEPLRYYVIHKPNTGDESLCVHMPDGKAVALCQIGVSPPEYDQPVLHPADLLEPWPVPVVPESERQWAGPLLPE